MICGKVPYNTRKEAVAAIQGLKKDKGVTRSRRQANKTYFCFDCNAFHLSTSDKHGRKRRTRKGSMPSKLTPVKPRGFVNLVIHNNRMPIK